MVRKLLLFLLLAPILSLAQANKFAGFGKVAAGGTNPNTFSPTILLYDNVGVLDATDVACSESEAVKTWQDQSGNAAHATISTAGFRPIWNSGAGLTFDGIDDILSTTATFAIARPRTFFVVLKYLGTDLANDGVLAGVFDHRDDPSTHMVMLRGGSYNGVFSRSFDGTTLEDVNASPSAVSTLNANTRVVLFGVYSATAQKMIWNGNVATGAASATDVTLRPIDIGYASGAFANIQMRAFGVIPSELTAQQIIDVNTWLDINFP